jgi:hypothetical protein
VPDDNVAGGANTVPVDGKNDGGAVPDAPSGRAGAAGAAGGDHGGASGAGGAGAAGSSGAAGTGGAPPPPPPACFFPVAVTCYEEWTGEAADCPTGRLEHCPTEGIVGGCQSVQGGQTQVMWYYSPRTAESIRQACAELFNGTFLPPPAR